MSMQCDEVARILPEAVEGGAAVELSVQRHIESCLRCQAELARYRRMLRGLQLLRTRYLEPTPGLLAQTLAAIEEAGERQAVHSILTGRRLAYAGAIAVNLVRGRDRIDCGCGGVAGRERISWWLVGRNFVCAAGAFAASSPTSPRELEWMDAFSVAAGIAVLAALYVTTDQLIANDTRMREAT